MARASAACAPRTPSRWIGPALGALTALGLAGATHPAAEPALDPVTAARIERIPLSGGGAGPLIERTLLGAEKARGRPARAPADALRTGKPKLPDPTSTPRNVPIRTLPNASENAPSVVASPEDPRRLVMAAQLHGESGVRCVAHSSRDAGQTWDGAPRVMPQLSREADCADPVLAYAPDGSRVYLAYLEVRTALSDEFQVLVSYSDDDGETWTGPIPALSREGSDYDKPWIATHAPGTRWQNLRNRDHVYVAATRFGLPGPCAIDFARSADQGELWSAPVTLDESAGSCGADGLMEGARPAAGTGPDVLVAWYHSADDGHLQGAFEIRTARSTDRGALFSPTEVAVRDSGELPFYLGPGGAYQRWWTAMFPAPAFADDGSAHILYTHDPDPDPASAEDGDIRHIASAVPGQWSEPLTLNDDGSGKAQGRAALAIESSGRTTRLFALWEDHRESERDNLEYDVFGARKRDHAPWGPNRRLTAQSSVVDYEYAGDAFSITAVEGWLGSPFVYGVWTDRRHQRDPLEVDDDVFGARLNP